VDATSQRVAAALAEVEDEARPLWTRRFEDALAGFRLLPDARVLASAGTGTIGWNDGGLVAVLNVAAFLRAPLSALAAFNHDAFVETAELSVRMLDNAALLTGRRRPGARLRIGVIGLADALALLGVAYDSDQGRTQAAAVARALAEGCLRGSVRLAGERGAADGATTEALVRADRRGCPDALSDAIRRHGVRYASLTAITAQPRLALFANSVADALDPLAAEDRVQTIEAAGGARSVSSPGYARVQRRRLGATDEAAPAIASCSEAGRRAMRNAVQPWIDADIDYPIRPAP
jgi:ribonucleoside-diphosphate reductase alpha chain